MLDAGLSVRISDICSTYDVSAVTARSDLDVLERTASSSARMAVPSP